MAPREVPISTRRYEAYSHQALKAEVEDGNDPGSVGEVSAQWGELAARLAESAQAIAKASGGSESSWTGEGGDAMRASVMSTASWSRQAADFSVGVANSLAGQASIASRAKQEMPEPVDYDPGQIIRSTVQSGNIIALCSLPATLWAKQAESEAAKQKAVDVMNARDAGLHTTAVREGFPQPKTER